MKETKNRVIIINGKPRSGKDTFCRIVEKFCEEHDQECYTWSTIDFEKELFEEITGREYLPEGPESANDRAFLSEFKQLLNKYFDTTFESFNNMIEFFPGILLVHSREWNEILDFGCHCDMKNIPFTTIFIDNPNEKEYNNSSDKQCNRNVEDYDFVFHNNGTIKEFEENVTKFCESQLL